MTTREQVTNAQLYALLLDSVPKAEHNHIVAQTIEAMDAGRTRFEQEIERLRYELSGTRDKLQAMEVLNEELRHENSVFLRNWDRLRDPRRANTKEVA